MRRYIEALRHRDFAALWLGATISVLGDGMTLVALTWLVYERTQSAVHLGWLTFAYTAPVVVGGLAAGVLLDRFDRRTVLMVDTLARGLVMGSVPVLHALGALETWYLFVVAATYGLLKMVPLAGVPALIPSLVPRDQLTTANAMESISYGVGGIIGPAIAGLLIAAIGAPSVVAIDALTYFAFLAALAVMRHAPAQAGPATPRIDVGLRPAVRVFVSSPPILATTLMFMAFNVGEGILLVALPIYAVEVLRQDAAAYGYLLAAFSAGVLLGAVTVGAIPTPARLGRVIARVQLVAGLTLLALVPQPALPVALVIGVAFGAVSSPLTIWAQTIRMRVIAAELRGRVFALLRTLMQSTPPIGGVIGGFAIATGGVAPALVLAVLVIAVPGLAGLAVRSLGSEYTDSGPRALPEASLRSS